MIVKAVEKTREVVTICKMKCKKANDALALKDKQAMWNVLQEYIHKFPELYTMANGVQLRRVDADFCEKLTKDDVANLFTNRSGSYIQFHGVFCAFIGFTNFYESSTQTLNPYFDRLERRGHDLTCWQLAATITEKVRLSMTLLVRWQRGRYLHEKLYQQSCRGLGRTSSICSGIIRRSLFQRLLNPSMSRKPQ